MEGTAIVATIRVVFENLIKVSWNEISLIRNLDKDTQKLRKNLAMTESYLIDAEKKVITQQSVKTWLKELESLAFDADDVLDELHYHILRNKVRKMKTRKNKVPSCFPSFNYLKTAHKIEELNMNLEAVNKKATDLGLESIVMNAPAPAAAAAAAFETDSFTDDPVFIGRDDDVPLLVEELINGAEERKFSILSIVGMGGMGKTTLARKVFNHQKMKTQFGSLIWVHVSQTFDPITLFKKILASTAAKEDESGEDVFEKIQKSFKSKTEEAENREVILKNLQGALKTKTCLLVLDDVWNQDPQKWEDFMNALSGVVTSIKGNGIILTTRNTEVASIVNPFHIHQLNPLSDEVCWSIIKAKTFENGDSVPSGFESIGRMIAKRCQGLPLAAMVVGGVLRRKSEDEWLSVQQNWLPDVEGDNNISKVLRLSFDNLSSPSLKKCFAYCSVFPKGHVFGSEELIELWMAEGFLQPDHRNDMESVGNKFLKILRQNSLLQVYGTNSMNCAMHDLVHDLACSVSVLGCTNHADGISRVRYMNHEHNQDKSTHIPKEVAKHLRTLFFEGEICDTMFSDFKCLHALTLTNNQVEELPNSVRKLIHLRRLDISGCPKIKELPEWIGELHHLQTIRVSSFHFKKLPSTIKYLIELRHLITHSFTELPAEIGRLTSLRTLQGFRVGDKKGCKIEELGSLKNLKGTIHISNLEKVHDKDEAMKANIFQKPNLTSLYLRWDFGGRIDERNNESVLEGLQPHSNIKVLNVHAFKGKRFPLWIMKMAVRHDPQGSWINLNNLAELTLSSCDECEEIPALGHLPNLKDLRLRNLKNLKSINSSFYGIDNNIGGSKDTIINVFPALEVFELSFMPELREWAKIETVPNREVMLFPRLEWLMIECCRHITFANIFELKITSLRHLHIAELDELECLPDRLFYNNQNLRDLTVSKCPRLRELPDGLHTLNSLPFLTLEHCPNLKWVGQSQGSWASICKLEIEGCPQLDFPCGMVESLAPCLQSLSLMGLKSQTLTRILDSLTKPKVVESPKSIPDSCSKILTFRRLKYLELDVSMESNVAIKEIVDAILQACCHSLEMLTLKGMEDWECLPGSIQHLTAVSFLTLENFGVEELPEWFGNLSALEWLQVYNCKKLRRMPSLDAMQRLTKLELVDIKDCSDELRVDSKYLKISNLEIRVDGDTLIDQPSGRLAFCYLISRIECSCYKIVHFPQGIIELLQEKLRFPYAHGDSLQNVHFLAIGFDDGEVFRWSKVTTSLYI